MSPKNQLHQYSLIESFKVTGEVAEAQSIRVGAFYEQQDTHRDNSASEVAIVDTGYAYDFADARLILQYTHYSQDLDGNRLRSFFSPHPRGTIMSPVTFLIYALMYYRRA